MLPVAPLKIPATAKKFSPVTLGSIGGGVVVLLLGGFLYLRSRKKAQAKLAEIEARLESEQNAALTAGLDEMGGDEEGMAEIDGSGAVPELQPAKQFQLAPIMTSKAEVLTKFIVGEAQKDPAALSRIVRTWLNEAKK